MATWDDVARICLALPGTTEALSRGSRHWRVADKLFVWERPLRRRDLEEVGDQGEVLGVRTADLDAKEAFLVEEPEVCFTTSHFDGYPAVLVRLRPLRAPLLRELLTEAWLARAPKTAVRQFLQSHPRAPGGS